MRSGTPAGSLLLDNHATSVTTPRQLVSLLKKKSKKSRKKKSQCCTGANVNTFWPSLVIVVFFQSTSWSISRLRRRHGVDIDDWTDIIPTWPLINQSIITARGPRAEKIPARLLLLIRLEHSISQIWSGDFCPHFLPTSTLMMGLFLC